MPIYFTTLDRVDTLLFLLIVSTASAILLKKWDIPYTIGLVPIGILIALLLHVFGIGKDAGALGLNRQLIMYVLLPALIFDAAINIDVGLLKKNLRPTLLLAGPGLVIAALITAGIVGALTPLSFGGCLIFGALISATDPVAVISLFELAGAPKRLKILMDGESIFNDASAIALFNVVLAAVLAGTGFSWGAVGRGSLECLWVFAGGFLIGALLGELFRRILRFAGTDPQLKVSLSLVLAYSSFLLADRFFGASGVMATTGAGIMLVRTDFPERSEGTAADLRPFWSLGAFLANSAIFLLLGFTEQNLLISADWGVTAKMVGAAILAVIAARIAVVFGMNPLLTKRSESISKAFRCVIVWGGLRGAVPLALIFSIPQDYPERTQIMQITLAVVLFTLLIPGLTVKSLLRHFKLIGSDGNACRIERRHF